MAKRSPKLPKPVAVGGGVLLAVVAVARIASDARRVEIAEAQWQRNPSLISFLHLLTSGVALARDISELG